MQRRTFLGLAGKAGAVLSLGPSCLAGHDATPPSTTSARAVADASPDVSASDWPLIAAALDDASSTFGSTWDDATCRTLMKGGYLGNGDFGAHLGGTARAPRFYLGKNGFHAGNDVAAGRYNQHILNLAILTVEAAPVPGEGLGDDAPARAAYRVTQDIRNAEVRTECLLAGSRVRTRAFLDPDDNVLVIEIATSGDVRVPLRATLSVVGNPHVARKAGHGDEVAWVTKDPNREGAPFYVQGAVAARVLGAKAMLGSNGSDAAWLDFDLPGRGGVVTLILSAEHTKNATSPLPAVQASARGFTRRAVGRIDARNRAWWRRFWLRSFVRVASPVQRLWYNHLYMVGSCARGGAKAVLGNAPGHWGPWNRADDMMWFSNLGMNYNAQNPYYGTFSSNHVELVDPYIETVRHYTETTGRRRVENRWVSPPIAARMPQGCRGVENEGSFTSHGTSCGGGRYPEEDCCMATNAVFGILPIVWKWKYGQDPTFLANTCYPLLRAVTDFYDDYIGQPVDGRYEVYGSVHEGADWFAKNDMFSLGAIRFLYREAIAASVVLGRDADRRAHWQDILDRMSEYPLQPWGDTVTFKPDGIHDVMEALHYRGGARNTGILFTTTFDNISHGTLPAYRIATCRTLDKGNMFHPQRWCGWQNGNDFGMMFVMAVRAGYPADRVLKAIQGWKAEPNGVVSQNEGGGIETAGIVEAINNMLLQSHDGVIRIFPNWDPALDARFRRLRAVGAFLVEARYRAAGRAVDSVRVFSEKGNCCRLQSPFAGMGVHIRRVGRPTAIPTVQDEEVFSFDTTPGATYEVTPMAYPEPPRGSPVITSHPASVTVPVPRPATFEVTATGEDLRYQWQRNRQDIPDATNPTYTTPPTTLWDIGSRYRCVVRNAAGVARSEPGILNPPTEG